MRKEEGLLAENGGNDPNDWNRHERRRGDEGRGQIR